jgi:hypothetical protein
VKRGNPALSAEKTLAQEIAGEGANQEQRELAAQIAEAQIDLMRVRRARHELLASVHSNPDYESPADERRERLLFGWHAPSASTRPFRRSFEDSLGRCKVRTSLRPSCLIWLPAFQSWIATSAVRSRGAKFAIRALDAARAELT